MLSESTPTYVYKLIPSSAPPPDPIPETLPLSPLDTASGFIHLSTALQIPSTLKLFFAKERRVYVLRLNYDQLDKDVRWEDPKAEGKSLGSLQRHHDWLNNILSSRTEGGRGNVPASV